MRQQIVDEQTGYAQNEKKWLLPSVLIPAVCGMMIHIDSSVRPSFLILGAFFICFPPLIIVGNGNQEIISSYDSL